MEYYRPLYRIITEHEYFAGKPCTSLQCRLSPQGEALARQRGWLFHPVAAHQWEVLYDAAGAGVDTENDVLELELSIIDADFVLYTDWQDFCPSASYRLELPLSAEEKEAVTAIHRADGKRTVGSPLCTVRLHVTEKLMEAAQAKAPQVCRLNFHAPKRYWEYIFLSRNDDGSVPAGELQLEDATGKLTFGKLHKTQAYGREAWRTLSTESIPMSSVYDCRLRLVWQSKASKRILMKQVEAPLPGRFQSNSIDCLRHVCYLSLAKVATSGWSR